MDKQATLPQLKDVYSLSQLVGEQFQKLIQTFGNVYTADLLDTVISALEHLDSSVEEVNKLQRRLCKLVLENDNLMKEKDNLKATLAMKEQDNERLKLHLEDALRLHNELLLTHQPGHKLEKNGDSGNIYIGAEDGNVSNTVDAMELPQMKRRQQQTENEFRRTRKKLLNVQATLMVQGVCIVTENNMLKAKLEESKALMGLQELQLTRSEQEVVNCCSPGQQESPRFYKGDLLAVLRERNELKEELDSLRDELNTTRLQFYRPLPTLNEEFGREDRFCRSRVRTIVTSITLPTVKEQQNKPRRKASSKPISS